MTYRGELWPLGVRAARRVRIPLGRDGEGVPVCRDLLCERVLRRVRERSRPPEHEKNLLSTTVLYRINDN